MKFKIKKFWKWYWGIGLVYMVIMIFLLLLFPNIFMPSIEDQKKEVIYFYKLKSFKGIVKNVFIDSSRGLSKTIRIKEQSMVTNNSFDFDSSGLYEFLKEGDSVEKRKGDLFVKVRRGKLDTIIYFDLGFDVEEFERELKNNLKDKEKKDH